MVSIQGQETKNERPFQIKSYKSLTNYKLSSKIISKSIKKWLKNNVYFSFMETKIT